MNTTDKQIIRVFPRRTKATPTDELVRINATPSMFDNADEVHISVAFTWDIPRAEWLEKQWQSVAPVKLGGPAFNERGGDFVPGMYLQNGYVITSRGCTNRCWFCSVPKREGYNLRELPVTDGWIVTDDNLLACSSGHIDTVFEMLKRQPHRPIFAGGLEAQLLTQDMAFRLKELKPERMFFAYDMQEDYEVRNEYFKGCTNKDITIIDKSMTECNLFEGFFDFLSYESLSKRFPALYPQANTLVLNSTVNLEKSTVEDFLKKHDVVNCYFDNDKNGETSFVGLKEKIGKCCEIKDKRSVYAGHKDFNEFVKKSYRIPQCGQRL